MEVWLLQKNSGQIPVLLGIFDPSGTAEWHTGGGTYFYAIRMVHGCMVVLKYSGGDSDVFVERMVGLAK